MSYIRMDADLVAEKAQATLDRINAWREREYEALRWSKKYFGLFGPKVRFDGDIETLKKSLDSWTLFPIEMPFQCENKALKLIKLAENAPAGDRTVYVSSDDIGAIS